MEESPTVLGVRKEIRDVPSVLHPNEHIRLSEKIKYDVREQIYWVRYDVNVDLRLQMVPECSISDSHTRSAYQNSEDENPEMVGVWRNDRVHGFKV